MTIFYLTFNIFIHSNHSLTFPSSDWRLSIARVWGYSLVIFHLIVKLILLSKPFLDHDNIDSAESQPLIQT